MSLDYECAPCCACTKVKGIWGGGEGRRAVQTIKAASAVQQSHCNRQYSTSSICSWTKALRSHLRGFSSDVGLQVRCCNPVDMSSCHGSATQSGNSHVICAGGTGYLNPRSMDWNLPRECQCCLKPPLPSLPALALGFPDKRLHKAGMQAMQRSICSACFVLQQYRITVN